MIVPLVDLYRTMAILNDLDGRLRSDIRRGQIVCTYFPMRGQEAVAAGMGAVLRPDDLLATTYRGLHDQVAKGASIRSVVAEMIGRQGGCAGGKGGGMHVADPESGVMLTTGIVGAGLPIGVGLALAAKFDAADRIALTSFGDGASNTGAFHESLNLAAVWQVPLIFLCQNNAIAEMTPFTETTRIAQVSDRAAGYAISGMDVDGNDPVAVYDALSAAAKQCRAGQGPVLVECHTVRPYGHHAGDDAEYLDPQVLAEAERMSPGRPSGLACCVKAMRPNRNCKRSTTRPRRSWPARWMRPWLVRPPTSNSPEWVSTATTRRVRVLA